MEAVVVDNPHGKQFMVGGGKFQSLDFIFGRGGGAFIPAYSCSLRIQMKEQKQQRWLMQLHSRNNFG